MRHKYIYSFDEGSVKMKPIMGSKGANLAEMTKIGLPVPPGFTITTEACIYWYKNGKYPEGLEKEIEEHVKKLEKKTGKSFGGKNPLLVSVRSGAVISMPGMMNTVLDLGMNDTVVKYLAEISDERVAYDCYRRFIQMFSDVVLEVEHKKFEELLEKYKKGRKDTDLNADELKKIVEEYKNLVKKSNKKLPDNPMEQLKMAITAVFDSWNNKRAVTYRKINNIPDDLGTAVNIQMMTYGNINNQSGSGVGFTRNPGTGKKEYYGEYLLNAQGEDVVAGIRTPKNIEEMKKDLPRVYKELTIVYEILEKHYKEMQDFEFTIENNKLYMLQTRTGKRTIQAAIKIAVDMVNEGLIDRKTAIIRIDPYQIDKLLHRRIDPSAKKTIIGKGLAASPGAASGMVVFEPDAAVEYATKGKKVILVRPETSPDDIHGMNAAQGILTSTGGMTSHAAVVARGMGKPCITGCGDIKVDISKREFSASGKLIKEGDIITIDGSSGEVMLDEIKTTEPEINEDFNKILSWADGIRRLGVRTNADLPSDAKKAREFGAEGIGLCRTEHMFFAEDRLSIMQKMIMADTTEKRKAELDKLLPMQKNDFIGIFKAMDGLPVTIRLLDPPLHEFLPNIERLVEEVTELKIKFSGKKTSQLMEKEALLQRVKSLSEFNPMLGLRGCRLGIVYPEIFDMQIKAIIEAALEAEKQGIKVIPEIMIPLVGHKKELEIIRQRSENIIKEILKGRKINYKIGTMIELPRACIRAGEIAEHADFFSFGTNDLTQTALGYSRDDAEGKFFKQYLDQGILDYDPFIRLDQRGVGALIKIAVDAVKEKKIKLGICGEHGGDPSSIEFCHNIGLDYVSCSPFRVPAARLSAAQAAIKSQQKK
ncbi:MAG: pyruvate, phosphate dikinase [Candidatus Aenigmarchaeota archaeon]|nr:pyruvate, phosphate dikinase [Candidatus Aenigmarchaeota archaeon]